MGWTGTVGLDGIMKINSWPNRKGHGSFVPRA